MVTILMMSAKLATPGLLKINIFWNKGYDDIIFDYGVNNKILSHDSNYIVEMVMWLEHFYKRSYHNLNIIRIWPEKPLSLRGGLGSSSKTWDWH